MSKVSPKNILDKSFIEINTNVQKLKFIRNEILNASKIIEQTIKKNKVLFCGNGGSASDAAHVSAELLGRFLKERKHSYSKPAQLPCNSGNSVFAVLSPLKLSKNPSIHVPTRPKTAAVMTDRNE